MAAVTRRYRLARNYIEVGEYLKELRIKSGKTQREVSTVLGYSSAQFISNFERGIALPPLKKLKTLQELYKGNVSKLIELTLQSERAILGKALKERDVRA